MYSIPVNADKLPRMIETPCYSSVTPFQKSTSQSNASRKNKRALLMLNDRKKSTSEVETTTKNSLATSFRSAGGTVNTKTTKDKGAEPDSNNVS